jgi:CheY-like chemotaxis protein
MTGSGRVPDGDAAARTSAAPPVILVIDDDPEVLELVRDVLAEAGLPTVTANDGEEGLELALARRPALIIMDVMMRGVDGYTALTRLRGHPATSDIPVIILTGQEEPIYRTLSHGVGAAAHFTKPFLPAVLTATVRRLLGQRGTS